MLFVEIKSKSTGKTMSAYVNSDLEAEEWIDDNMFNADGKGLVWWKTVQM